MKIILLALLVFSIFVNAQVLPGIHSKGGAMIMPSQKLKMGIKHIYLKKENMFNGTSSVTNQQNLDANVHVTLLAMRYSLNESFELRVVLPYKNVSASAQLGMNKVRIENQGLGDIIVMGRYVILPMDDYGFQLSIGGGLKLPTGLTNDGFKEAPAFARTTNTPLPTQMGTGEYEYKMELGLSKEFENNSRVDFHTMFTYRPRAEHDYNFGNELSYDLSYTAGLTSQINIGIEYNGKYNSSTDMGDDTNAMLRANLPFKSLSGAVGYVTPQVEFVPFDKPKFHIGLGVSFLAHYNVSEYQPLAKTKFMARVGYVF